MKIAIAYPPLPSPKGIPLLSQNRQFQWFSNPTYIYPVVPAYAASLLQARGHEPLWRDGVAQGLGHEQWLRQIENDRPDMLVMESKTPVIKMHWEVLKTLRKTFGETLRLVLVGDHVSALPEESLRNSPVDFIITGGDYDFVLADLADAIANDGSLPAGVWHWQNGEVVNTGAPQLRHDLNELPLIDRKLTQWQLYAYKNGNFKYTPGTYTMAGRDCWWGRCTFCSWTTLYPGATYRTVTVERHLEEIGQLIELGVKEIFDDSGCFPKGEWLEQFCRGMIERGYHKKVVMGCNMRVGALTQEQWNLLGAANFRFLLIGLESMNQNTLNRLNKGIKQEQIEETMRMAKKAGLEPHITTMVGYPWESREDAQETVDFARRMFVKGYIDTLQATIVVPYPGTPLFQEALEQGWLTTTDWERYDMRESVWNSPVSSDDVKCFTQQLYKAALSPMFILRKLLSIRRVDDVKFLLRAAGRVMGHLTDFRR